MAAHVSAWRRLGLKLKNEPGTLKHEQNSAGATRQPDKVRGSEASIPERPAKRRRLSHDQESRSKGPKDSGQAATADNGELPKTQTSDARNGRFVAAAGGKTNVKRKKSVTFTTETKTEDGDSRITIDFPSSSSSPKAKADQPSNVEPFADQQPDAPASEADKSSQASNARVKKSKKSKKSRARPKLKPDEPATREKGALALGYLSQFQSDRESWKFNKNRDIWILNNALDVQSIPDTYCFALANYVAGLPEKAAARDRLVKQCIDMSGPNRTEKDGLQEEKAKFNELLARAGSVGDSDMSEFLNDHSRPAVLLWALRHEVPGGEKANAEKHSQLPRLAENGKRVKKKKTRVLKDIEFSSSESESEPEEDDKNIVHRKGAAIDRTSTEDDTLSSDSEISSSGDSTSSAGSSSTSSSSE